jgi:hypothetical protein
MQLIVVKGLNKPWVYTWVFVCLQSFLFCTSVFVAERDHSSTAMTHRCVDVIH